MNLLEQGERRLDRSVLAFAQAQARTEALCERDKELVCPGWREHGEHVHPIDPGE